ITLRDVLAKGYTGREMRYFLIRTHYRKPINFSFRSLDAARKNLQRLDGFIVKLLCLPPGLPHPEVAAYLSDMEDRFFTALDDDLNVSKAFAALFDFVKKTNQILSQGLLDREQKDYILEALRRINTVLRIMRLEECPLAPEIDRLIRDREEARKQKDWQKADGVRQELAEKGIEVVDTAKGPVWKEVEKKD
ncbi:MAG: cysteine--tRNA ligase, partial [Proteobacteria bacterium]|nr:cysteine--tRNA ligase [Pseudomonadota bacterium]